MPIPRARCCGKRDAEPWRINDIGSMRRYALKHEAYAMKLATGAITWMRSQNAEPGDLDLHISGTQLIDPNPSPTGGGIVLGCGVTLPKSIGRLRLSNRDPRAAPHIHHNFSIIKTISVGGGGGPVPENRPNRAVPKPDRR